MGIFARIKRALLGKSPSPVSDPQLPFSVDVFGHTGEALVAFQREWAEKLSRPSSKPADHIQTAFEKFHAENPIVFQLLVSNALQVKAKGHTQYGIKTLFELVRWHYDVDVNVGTNAPYKLNNNYTSSYARLIMDTVPELKGFFKLRGSK